MEIGMTFCTLSSQKMGDGDGDDPLLEIILLTYGIIRIIILIQRLKREKNEISKIKREQEYKQVS